MVVFSTHIDKTAAVATIEIHLGEGIFKYSFSIVPKYLNDVFDFRYFEYYLYLYRGKNVAPRINTAGITLHADTLKIETTSTKGNITVDIPYDDSVKKLMYECAHVYLNYHLSKSPTLVPQIYVDVLAEDRGRFS